jgi:hypothetical protein
MPWLRAFKKLCAASNLTSSVISKEPVEETP